ncbi:ABC transporter, substrate binding protein, phosphate [Prochlorococcus marinus str. NATL1A]|jgi:phosphate transport system substrate-binding protein|uniref:Phosphate-binding protein n=1 Tax=Prochlorococcus marinus (strain NATL1A) TaxID=167555 RepID=Q0GLJ3_PROM1|nr:phosphate ABC transporter substrate-binding protein PstS [Prochlorococcus marinus]ABI21868.1 ABC transporter [Prochlorococcus marinus str. NATL1A]ABM75710.1 ABC transporter, substrate binding protein, phosphate [Prochlorococcus marinus str. NATL1A]
MTFAKKALIFTSLLAVGAGMSATAASRLSGAGASFPAKIYTRWFSDLAKEGGPRVNYQAVGSGSGRKAFIDQTVNFGASDDPMKAKDIAKVTRGLVQIPMVGGTIAFGYNYDCDLKLTQEQAVRVAMGKISNWKEVGCPAGKMTWAHRSDGSGTTKAFSNSMQAFSKTWNLGTGKSIAWPAGVGGKGNAGVAGVIRNTPGAIGYVNQSYIKGEIKAAALQNLSGEYLKPSTESGAKALNGIKLDENLAGKNPNPKAKGAYPIATLTWILAYEEGNGRNTKAIQKSLNYLLSDKAQAKAPSLGFVPLKGEILKKSRAAVKRIGK